MGESSAGDKQTPVLRCAAVNPAKIDAVLGRYGLTGVALAPGDPIPGSHWGPPEAGLIADRIHFRPDTPVHSLLHELAHYVCMDPMRRARLHTDAGGTDAEECAVCYLEVLLAGYLEPFDANRCLADMDAWGYSFREGAAGAWFHGDGREAHTWLIAHGLIEGDDTPTWRLRLGSVAAGVRPRGLTPVSDTGV